MKIKRLVALSLSVLVVPAFAADTVGSFSTNASVSGTCMITSNSSADFSDLDAINSLGGNISNVMMVKCTAGSVGVKISMDQGANPDAGSTCDAPLRRMKSEHGDYIPYTLRAKTVSSNPWSDIGCGASNHVEMPTFTSSLDPAPVWRHFGWAPGQDLKIGTYVDTVGVTVTF